MSYRVNILIFDYYSDGRVVSPNGLSFEITKTLDATGRTSFRNNRKCGTTQMRDISNICVKLKYAMLPSLRETAHK